jgi:hypothetical protein
MIPHATGGRAKPARGNGWAIARITRTGWAPSKERGRAATGRGDDAPNASRADEGRHRWRRNWARGTSNAINSGMVGTEGFITARFAESAFRKDVEARTPLGRIGQTRDIAPAVSLLASEEADWIPGETLVIVHGLRGKVCHPLGVRLTLDPEPRPVHIGLNRPARRHQPGGSGPHGQRHRLHEHRLRALPSRDRVSVAEGRAVRGEKRGEGSWST